MASWMAETAKEELRLLESEHPNRFDYLKMELKALISLAPDDPHSSSSSSTLSTQVSSNRKRNKDEDLGSKEEEEEEKKKKKKKKKKRNEEDEEKWKRNSVEMALERAHACLLRLQQFKLSFFH